MNQKSFNMYPVKYEKVYKDNWKIFRKKKMWIPNYRFVPKKLTLLFGRMGCLGCSIVGKLTSAAIWRQLSAFFWKNSTLEFRLSKIVQVFLKKITVCGIFRTRFLIKIHKLYGTKEDQVRKGHCLVFTIHWYCDSQLQKPI